MKEVERLLKELLESGKEVAEDNFREYPDRGSIHRIADNLAWEVQYTVNRILKLIEEEE